MDIDDDKTAVNYSLIFKAIGIIVAVVSLYYVRKEGKPQKVLDTLE